MKKLITIIVAILALGSPVYGQNLKALAEDTCSNYRDVTANLIEARDAGISKERLKATALEKHATMDPSIGIGLLNSQNKIIDEIYNSSCSSASCESRFSSKAYDGCINVLKKFAASAGVVW